MGATISVQKKNKTPDEIKNILNKIFVDFIKTSNFDDFTKFHLDPNIREKITIITNESIEKNLNLKDIEYISNEIYQDELLSTKQKEKVIVLKNDDISKLDVYNKKYKKELASGIAKYYLKIYSIFAAVIVTVHPEFDKTDSPASSLLSSSNKNLSLCSRRIHALTDGEYNLDDPDGNVTIKPQKYVCEFSLQDKLKSKTEKGYLRKLSDEVGISQLQQMYFDVFDPKSGTFNDMTSKAKSKFQKDLQSMYKTYTGNTGVMNENIDSFSKIPLKDYHNSSYCSSEDDTHKYPEKLYGNLKTDTLFKQYADVVNKLIHSNTQGLNSLLKIIDVIFKVIIDDETGEKEIVINSSITMSVLDKISQEVIDILMKLYTACEDNFQKGIDIINAIVAIDKFNLHVSTDAVAEESIKQQIFSGVPDIDPDLAPGLDADEDTTFTPTNDDEPDEDEDTTLNPTKINVKDTTLTPPNKNDKDTTLNPTKINVKDTTLTTPNKNDENTPPSTPTNKDDKDTTLTAPNKNDENTPPSTPTNKDDEKTPLMPPTNILNTIKNVDNTTTRMDEYFSPEPPIGERPIDQVGGSPLKYFCPVGEFLG